MKDRQRHYQPSSSIAQAFLCKAIALVNLPWHCPVLYWCPSAHIYGDTALTQVWKADLQEMYRVRLPKGTPGRRCDNEPRWKTTVEVESLLSRVLRGVSLRRRHRLNKTMTSTDSLHTGAARKPCRTPSAVRLLLLDNENLVSPVRQGRQVACAGIVATKSANGQGDYARERIQKPCCSTFVSPHRNNPCTLESRIAVRGFSMNSVKGRWMCLVK